MNHVSSQIFISNNLSILFQTKQILIKIQLKHTPNSHFMFCKGSSSRFISESPQTLWSLQNASTKWKRFFTVLVSFVISLSLSALSISQFHFDDCYFIVCLSVLLTILPTFRIMKFHSPNISKESNKYMVFIGCMSIMFHKYVPSL